VVARNVRERIAIALLASSLVVASVLGVMTVLTFTQGGAGSLGSGQVAGAEQQPQGGGGQGNVPGQTTGGTGSSSQSQSGVSGGTITIGGFFDISGPIDSSVERDTVRAYMQGINAAGGINGRKVQYLWCDSKYDASAAHSCAEYLISQHVLAVVGLTAPLGENNEIGTLTAAGIPVIGGLGTPAEYTNSLAFPVSANFYRYGAALADEARAIGAKHPAVVVLADVPWVKPVEANLLNRLAADGIQYTDVEEVSATQANYTATVFNLQHSHHGPSSGGAQPGYTCPPGGSGCPDYVIAALDPFSYHRLFDAMEAASWYPHVLGAGLDKFNVQRSYDKEIYGAHSLVPFLSPYDHQSNPTVRQYLGSVEHYYPGQFQALDIYTQHAWTAAMVFAAAAKAAGSNLTQATLIQQLQSLHNFQTGWSVPLSYGTGAHDPNHCFTYTLDQAPRGSWHTTTGWICS
jgi:ABC-type branched-subunit amino acid transport system substrate-binding protein